MDNGLCSTAESANIYRFGLMQRICNSSTCDDFHRAADIVSVVLQLEYVGNRGTFDFSRECVVDLLLEMLLNSLFIIP